jgi:enoyl reductase-like protein
VLAVIEPTVKEQIQKDLDSMSPKLQLRALRLVHNLIDPHPRGASVEDMMSVAGILDDESAREMIEAIEEGCERIDPEGW